MPAISNPRHERFAQELAQGKTADEAYVSAGYKPNRGNATTLKAKQSILDRVSEIVGRGAVRAEITLESLMREADEIQIAAIAANQLSAATGALTVKAKLAGLWIDKSDNTNTNRNIDAASVTDAELAAIVQANGSSGTAAQKVDTSKLN